MSYDEYQSVLPAVRAFGLVQQLKRLGWSIKERPDLVPSDAEVLRNTVTCHLQTMVAALIAD